MKITGDFEVTSTDKNGNKQKVAQGKNTFTNVGRQHVCDWLMHDNYSEDAPWNGSNQIGGGRSISSERIIPYTDVAVYRTGSNSTYISNEQGSMYPNNSSSTTSTAIRPSNATWDEGTYNTDYGTLFWEFNEPKDIKGIIIWGYEGTWYYAHPMDFSTSPNTFAENINWTRQNVKFITGAHDDTSERVHAYRWDYHNHPNRTIEGVKTLRLRLRHDYTTSSTQYFYGVWFLERNDYPNTPSVIALGTDNTSPALTDTALGAETVRNFIRVHKETGDVTKIKYSMRLNFNEGNDTTFREVGLFVNPIAGDYIGGDHLSDYCTKMFARGVFDTPWSKTSAQIIDVDYTITISN